MIVFNAITFLLGVAIILLILAKAAIAFILRGAKPMTDEEADAVRARIRNDRRRRRLGK